MPKVSIIIPVFNVEKYLDRCIQSVKKQTLKEIEIILVNDNSSDKCPEMCDLYAKEDIRIKVIHKSKNEGLGFARNTGLKIATGEFVAFVDSDDYIAADMYENMYNTANELSLNAFYCRYCRVSGKGIQIYTYNNDIEVFKESEDIQNFLLDMIGCEPECSNDRKYEMSTCTVIYRNDIIKENDIKFHSEREIISEDLFFQIDFLQHASKIAFTEKAYYYYCLNEVSLSNSFRLNRFDKYIHLKNETKKKLDSLFGEGVYNNRVDRLFIGYTRSLLLSIDTYNITNKYKIKIINEICMNYIWEDIYNQYPINKLPFKQKLIIYLLRKKMTYFILLISKLKRIIKR